MAIRRFTVPVTSIADGSATAYTPPVYGRLVSISYVKTDYDNGVGVTVTGDLTGTAIWAEAAVNASAVRHPRAATHSTAGVAALYAGGGLAVNDKVAVSGERIKIVLAAAGNVKTGTFHFTIDG